jgi:hypothetical protein
MGPYQGKTLGTPQNKPQLAGNNQADAEALGRML